MSYSGLVRVLDSTGVLLTVGEVDLANDPDTSTWGGILRVLDGTGVARKALVVKLDINGHRGDAVLDPITVDGGTAISKVIGTGPAPF
jgi:hypothetical protein